MEKRTILHILAIITLASVLLSCDGRNSRFAQQLDMLDTLMLHRPDSAYNALLGMAKEADTQRKPLRMRYALTLADAQNKAYVDFTSDSVMKEVVDTTTFGAAMPSGCARTTSLAAYIATRAMPHTPSAASPMPFPLLIPPAPIATTICLARYMGR